MTTLRKQMTDKEEPVYNEFSNYKAKVKSQKKQIKALKNKLEREFNVKKTTYSVQTLMLTITYQLRTK